MSVLVFCANKKWCHRLAHLLAGEIREHRKVERRRESTPAAAANAISATKTAHPASLGPGQRPKERTPKPEAYPSGGQAAQSGRAKDIGLRSRGCESHGCRTGDISTVFISARAVDGCGGTKRSKVDFQGTASGEGGASAAGQGTSEENMTWGGRAAASTAAAAAAVTDKLRETPVGLDPDLRYLVRCMLLGKRKRLCCVHNVGSVEVIVMFVVSLSVSRALPLHLSCGYQVTLVHADLLL